MCINIKFVGRSERGNAKAGRCGNCKECEEERRQEWKERLTKEIETNKPIRFITLEISEERKKEIASIVDQKEGYELEKSIAIKAIRRFTERWRKIYKTSMKHWFVVEIEGETEKRINIHGMIFTEEEEPEIRERWKYGNVRIITETTKENVKLITEYITKSNKGHEEYKKIILCSNGIGKE